MPRFAGLANRGGVRRGSERNDRPSRTEPKPPKDGEAFTILLYAVPIAYILNIYFCKILNKLKKLIDKNVKIKNLENNQLSI